MVIFNSYVKLPEGTQMQAVALDQVLHFARNKGLSDNRISQNPLVDHEFPHEVSPFWGGIPHVQSNPQKYPMISQKKYPVKSNKITRESHKSSCHARKHCLFRPESHHHHLCGKNRLNKRHGLILQQCRMGMEKPIILFLLRLLLLLLPDGFV